MAWDRNNHIIAELDRPDTEMDLRTIAEYVKNARFWQERFSELRGKYEDLQEKLSALTRESGEVKKPSVSPRSQPKASNLKSSSLSQKGVVAYFS